MQAARSVIIGTGLSILIGLGAAPGVMAKGSSDTASAKETAKELQALREQVEALQRRLDAQAASEEQTKAQAASAAAQAASAKADAAAVPAQLSAEVHKAVDAAKPKTDKIYYKGVTITLGGFLAAESVYRSRSEQADIGSSFSAVPFNNSSLGQTSELRFTARQSRVTALAQGDVSPDTHLGFYSEVDFLGAAQTANSNESNSFTPRIRQMFGTVDWDASGLHFLAGQAWSLVTLTSKGITPRSEVLPPVIDAQYVPGFNWARQPQIRLTKDFDKQVWLAVSLENPQTTFYTGANALPSSVHLTYNAPAGSLFNSANTMSLNHVPDVVAKIAADPSIADRTIHLEAYGLYRSFYERLNFANQSTSGGGVGAGLIIPLVPKFLEFQLSGLGGKGIGRYGSGQLADVTFDPAGNIRPISEIQAMAGLTVHPTPKLDVYLFAGEEKDSAQAYYLNTGGGTIVGYGYGNPLYSNSGCAGEQASGGCVGNTRLIQQGTTGFWYRPYVGSFGRIQWGLQYSYTERKAFAGVDGIAPVANDSMVFASFRYYPY